MEKQEARSQRAPVPRLLVLVVLFSFIQVSSRALTETQIILPSAALGILSGVGKPFVPLVSDGEASAVIWV